MSQFKVVEIAPGECGVQAAMAAVHALFEEEVSLALVPMGDAKAREALRETEPLHTDEPTLVLCTSGSLGAPKAVELTVTALGIAATQSAEYLGDQSVWLTCLPVTSMGGLNTVVRAALAGLAPVIWDGVAGASSFEAEPLLPFLHATIRSARKLRQSSAVSLVPTQAHRLSENPETLATLAHFDFVLVGGGALNESTARRLREAEVNVIRTYGATETCGGVVYDGKPLSTVAVTVDDDGQLLIDSLSLATCYRDGTPIASPWPTGDLGTVVNGIVSVNGRMDDVIKVAGQKVDLAALATLVGTLPGVDAAAAAGAPHAEYGSVPVIAYSGSVSAEAVEELVRAADFGRLPLRVRRVESLPLLPNGKPDRGAIAAL